MGKLKTYSPTHCIMDNGENRLNLTHTLDKIYLRGMLEIKIDPANSCEPFRTEGFDSCDRPSNLTEIGFKSSFFQHVCPWNVMDDLGKQYGTPALIHQLLCIILKSSANSNWSYSPVTHNSGLNRHFLVRCNLGNLTDDLQNNRTPLLCYLKLLAPFRIH